MGEIAVVFDKNDNFIALGLYDPQSPIRLRIIHRGKPEAVNREWWNARLCASLARREGILNDQTNAARLINGENDGFPALVLDRYGETLVLKIYSAVWFQHLGEIVSVIEENIPAARLVLRLSRNIMSGARRENFEDGSVLYGSKPEGPVIFLESGLRFEADVLKGQKTGFFLDQRENRRDTARLSAGKDVLNAFSFSGAFSLYAASAGARSVTDIDISGYALDSSRRNFALNAHAVARTEHHLIQADVFEWLQEPRSELYDVVILDPPSLAKRQLDRAAGLKAYANLAVAGLRLARPGGMVVCCSCSAHIRAEEFFEVVRSTAVRFGRAFQVFQTTRQPADHHATFAEAEYLKAIYLRL